MNTRVEELQRYVEHEITVAMDTLDAFAERFTKDAAVAFGWNGTDAIEAAAMASVGHWVVSYLGAPGLRPTDAVVGEMLLRRTLSGARERHASTSVCQNLVEDAKTRVWAKLAEWWMTQEE